MDPPHHNGVGPDGFMGNDLIKIASKGILSGNGDNKGAFRVGNAASGQVVKWVKLYKNTDFTWLSSNRPLAAPSRTQTHQTQTTKIQTAVLKPYDMETLPINILCPFHS